MSTAQDRRGAMGTTKFDPTTYKDATRAQWQAAAAAWHTWGPVIGAWLGQATELMLDLAQVGTAVHDRVQIDLARQVVAGAVRPNPFGLDDEGVELNSHVAHIPALPISPRAR